MGNQQSIEQARNAHRRRLRIGAAIMLGGIVSFFSLVVLAVIWVNSAAVADVLERVLGVAA